MGGVCWVAVVFGAAWSALGAEAVPTIIAQERAAPVPDALVIADQLWVPLAGIEAANGFTLKEQGLCRGEVCIPVRKDDPKLFLERDGKRYFNLEAFAAKLGQPVAASPGHKAWCFGPVPELESGLLAQGKAPDFAVPDRHGKIVHLADFRGKKVMLLAWASW